MVFVFCALLPSAVWAQGPATRQEKGDSATVEKAKPDFGTLKGRWVRTDGGYILSVKDVDPDGKMDAAYYNPRPVNISKAQATREGDEPESLHRAAGYRVSRIDLHAHL